MALEVSCTRCTDPTCSGKEYQVKYDYDHFGRIRGTKTVCESQVWKQGGRCNYTIHTGRFRHTFEAVPIEKLEEEAEEFPEVPVTDEWYRKNKGERIVAQEVDIDYSKAIKPQERVVEDEGKESPAGSKDTGTAPSKNGKTPKRKTPTPRKQTNVRRKVHKGKTGK